ncbi:hypothetical protein TNCV_2623101 [Trichonephila clavipes]|nr:hypothetical protein TNCV_2623101 [Trichonephila clavipes]
MVSPHRLAHLREYELWAIPGDRPLFPGNDENSPSLETVMGMNSPEHPFTPLCCRREKGCARWKILRFFFPEKIHLSHLPTLRKKWGCSGCNANDESR